MFGSANKGRWPANNLLVIAIVIVGLVASSAHAVDAPLGLSWAASVEQIKALGVELKSGPAGDYGDSYIAGKLPRAVSDQETTLLSFGFDDKLWRMVAIGRRSASDPYGSAVKQRYQELVNVLSEKYGKPHSHHALGENFYSKPENFVWGIKTGQSNWYTNFDSEDVNVQIAIVAEDSDTARWRIIYEFKPLRAAFETGRRSREKGTL